MAKCLLDIKLDIIDAVRNTALDLGGFKVSSKDTLEILDSKKASITASKINSDFKENIIIPSYTSKNHYSIIPSDELSKLYLNKYNKEFLSGAIKLKQDELDRGVIENGEREFYQLNSNNTSNSIKELDDHLIDFLKSFNVKTKQFDDLKARLEVDALGATDVLNKLIWYSKNRNEETIPEEAAHMLVMLMGNKHFAIKELMDNIENWSEFSDIKKEYENLYNGDINKIKIEAIGKLIAKALVKNYKAVGLDQSRLQKIIDIIKKFIDNILNNTNNSLFHLMSYNEYLADHIAINILSSNKEYVYKITNKNSNVDFNYEINNNILAKSIINKFASTNVKLTGSLAIAAFGENIQRPKGDSVHDLDFRVKSFDAYEKEVIPKIKQLGGIPAHYGWHKKTYSTLAFLIPKPGYTIEVLKRKNDYSNGLVESYHLKDENGNYVQGSSKNCLGVDFFVYRNEKDSLMSLDNSSYQTASEVYEGKLSLGGNSNPLFFHREKDQEDFVIRNPKSFIPTNNSIFYQLNNNSNIPSNTIKPGVQENTKESTKEINDKVKRFLINIGVNYKAVEGLTDAQGNKIEGVALADMMNKIIQVIEGKADITTLPEEAAHFFVEMLGENHPLFKQMMEKVTSYDLYKEVVNEYKNDKNYRNPDRTINFNKIKKEAIGKIIARYLTKTLSEKDEKNTDSFWKRLWSIIKTAFGKASSNPFEESANKILNSDISDLNTDMSSDEIYLSKSTGVMGIDKVLEDQKLITLDESLDEKGEKKHIYQVDGVPVVDKEGNPRSVTSVLVDAWYRTRFKVDKRDERQKNIDKLKAEEGSKLHEDINNIVKRYFDESGNARKAVLPVDKIATNKTVYDKMELYIKALIDQYKGSRFLSEIKVFDPKRNLAGSIDLLIVNPDNSVDIYDWKSQEIRPDETDLKWFKEPAYRVQLNTYKEILRDYYGFKKFNKVRAIPIKTVFNMVKSGKTWNYKSIKDIEVGNIDPKGIGADKYYLLPVVMEDESTNDKELDELITKLYKVYEKAYQFKVDGEDKYKKFQELNIIKNAIRELQIKGNFSNFINTGIMEVRKYKRLLDSNDLTFEDIKDGKNICEVYSDSTIFLEKKLEELDKERAKYPADSPMGQYLINLKVRLLDMAQEARKLYLQLKKKEDELGDTFAKKEGITTLLRMQRPLDKLQQWFKSPSTIDLPAVRLFYRLLSKAQTKRNNKFEELVETKNKIQAEYEKWAVSKGLSGVSMFKYLFKHDEKGNWVPKLVNKYNPEFFKLRDKAIREKNFDWLKANTNFNEDAYKLGLEAFTKYVEENSLSPDEEESKKAQKKAIDNWIATHFNNSELAYLNKNNYYISPKENWLSTEYSFIYQKGNEPLKAAYELITKLNAEAAENGMLPTYNARFFPMTYQDTLERMTLGGNALSIEGLLKNMEVSSENGFGQIDPLSGQLIKEIPVYYTRDIGIKKEDGTVDYGNVSKDFFKVVMLWGAHIYNYEAMNSIRDTSNGLVSIEKNKKALKTNYFGKVALGEEGGSNKVNADYLESMVNYYVYGITEKGFYDKTFKKGDKEYSYSRGIGQLLSYTTMKTLSLNPLSGTAAFVGALGNAFFQAEKRLHFTSSQWALGLKEYTTNDKTIHGLLDYFGLELDDDKFRKANQSSVSSIIRNATTEKLMFMQRWGDKLGIRPVGAALMHSHMIDENNNIVSILDYVKSKKDYNNFYNLSKDERNKVLKEIEKEVSELEKTKSLKVLAKIVDDKIVLPGIDYNSETAIQFRRKALKIMKNIIGNASRDDINQIRTTLLGQALMQYRSWMPQLITERFGSLSFDEDMQTYQFGKARVLWNHLLTTKFLPLVGEMITGFGDASIARAKQQYVEMLIKAKENGLIENDSEFMTEAEFIDMYKANLRSMTREIIVLLSFASLLLSVMGGDDDDRDSKAIRAYLRRGIEKYINEFWFFYSPTSATDLLGNGIPLIGILNDSKRFLTNGLEQIYGASVSNDQLMDDAKPLKYLGKILPVTKQLEDIYAIFDDDFRKEWNIKY